MSPTVLLSGFEPFDGAGINESWEAVRAAVPLLAARGIDAEALLLPVEFGVAADRLLARVAELSPSLVLATGLAAGRSTLSVERVAVNLRDARIPDAAGRTPLDEPCAPGGPVGLFPMLPVKAMVRAAEDVGAPVSLSQSAGTYVCNDVFYLLTAALGTDPRLRGVRGGFVHVPPAAAVDTARVAEALAAMAERALGQVRDDRTVGGAEH